MKIKRSTRDYSDEIKRLKRAIEEADAVVIGAGAGLSTSAGYDYSGETFDKYFFDFRDTYGITDIYSGGFYPFETPEEYWAWWSRHIYLNRYVDPKYPVYEELFDLVQDKNYFVITTNVDHCFQKAGFDKNRLFYTQGDYGLLQCSGPCTNETYDNEELVLEMLEKQENMKVPSELIPYCPHCGRPLTMNLRADDKFVEDSGWHRAAKNYQAFLEENAGKKILFLELGIGFNTPGIIKFPFWRMTFENENALYANLNQGEAAAPEEILERSILLNGDIRDILKLTRDK